MHPVNETELLILWEHGLTRHMIDRGLLLCSWARPDLPSSQLADLPLSMINDTLLQLHELLIGPQIQAYVDCENCSERLEITLDATQLSSGSLHEHVPVEFEVSGRRFRAPCSRDLAAIAEEKNVDIAALKLLNSCYLRDSEAEPVDLTGVYSEFESTLEAIDLSVDISLALDCDVCGHRWEASVDICTLLWDEIEARARKLLSEVHHLAHAYGWSESSILELSPQRRSVYLEQVVA